MGPCHSLVSRFRSSFHLLRVRTNFGFDKDTSIIMFLVWLMDQKFAPGLAKIVERTSDPPHWTMESSGGFRLARGLHRLFHLGGEALEREGLLDVRDLIERVDLLTDG